MNSVGQKETDVETKTHEFSHRPTTSLIAIFLGAFGFVLMDRKFKLHSYFWGVAYVLSMTVDMVLIKKIVTIVVV